MEYWNEGSGPGGARGCQWWAKPWSYDFLGDWYSPSVPFFDTIWEKCLQYSPICWILHTDLHLYVLYSTILMIEPPFLFLTFFEPLIAMSFRFKKKIFTAIDLTSDWWPFMPPAKVSDATVLINLGKCLDIDVRIHLLRWVTNYHCLC